MLMICFLVCSVRVIGESDIMQDFLSEPEEKVNENYVLLFIIIIIIIIIIWLRYCELSDWFLSSGFPLMPMSIKWI